MLSKKNTLLLLLLLALIAITWLEPGIKKITQQPLTSLQPATIDYIRISDTSGRDIELERHANGWRMLQPTAGDANSERIEQLLGLAQTHSHSHFSVADSKLVEYGLLPPPITLQLNDLQLHFGNNDPVYQRRYVKIGKQIHLIDDGFQHHLLAPATEFAVLSKE